jgi:hypothetical protein
VIAKLWKNIIKHLDPDLENKATYVTVRFEAQKNREKCDVRTQRSTGDYVLCLVRRLARAVIRCHRSNLSVSANTPICLFNGSQITSAFTRKLLRKTCDVFGGKDKFGAGGLHLNCFGSCQCFVLPSNALTRLTSIQLNNMKKQWKRVELEEIQQTLTTSNNR